MDTVAVRFAGLDRVFNVSKTLVEFTIPFTQKVISIKWYGAIIAFGFLLAVLFGGRIAYKWKISLDKMVDVLIYGTICGIIGARLYYVAFEWDYYSQHLGEIVQIWNGGLAIYGGLIGGLIGAYITCRIEKINFLNLLDMVSMSFLIGQGIGRWGNFANQEAFGTFTTKPWGMMSDTVLEYIQRNPSAFGLDGMTSDQIATYVSEKGLYVHPTFLYESIWCLLGFVVLYIILRKFRKFSGQLFLTYGVWYGAERAVVEGLRTDSLFIGNTGLRVSQLISIILASVSLVLLVALLIKYKKNPKPIEGVDFFPEKTAKELEAEEKARKKKEEKANIRANRGVVIRNGKIVKDGRKKKPDDDTNIEPVRFGPEDKESNPEDENN
ncbi:MAG: prolipoprotein diacylglyceryl transferase [Oscillospiraceae bacterium]|nr:prolipoprotein diacylglyceryl transferase [Oscillospiraceae bacterium]